MAQAIPAIAAIVGTAAQMDSAKRDAQAKSKANMDNSAGSFDFKSSVERVAPQYGNQRDRLNDMVVGAGMTALPGAMASPASQYGAASAIGDVSSQAGVGAPVAGFPATATQPQVNGYQGTQQPGQPFPTGASAAQPGAATKSPAQQRLDNAQGVVGMTTSIAGLMNSMKPQAMPLAQGAGPQFRPTTQQNPQADPRYLDYVRRMQGGY